jgi:hypothetical protein
MALVKINGRQYFVNCDTITIKPVSAGRWEVKYDDHHTFIVVGGRDSGGASNEWFCYHPTYYGEKWLPCASMVEAVKLGVQY